MTVIFENETGVYLRKIYKAGNHKEKIILNGRFSNLNNGYFAVEEKIVPLQNIGDKRAFNKALKQIDKSLKFSGTDKDYETFKENLK